jgi:hypothetical protein
LKEIGDLANWSHVMEKELENVEAMIKFRNEEITS